MIQSKEQVKLEHVESRMFTRNAYVTTVCRSSVETVVDIEHVLHSVTITENWPLTFASHCASMNNPSSRNMCHVRWRRSLLKL